MDLFSSGSIIIATIALLKLLWELFDKRSEHLFYWHRLSSPNNYYVTIITQDNVTHIVDIMVIDKNSLSDIKVNKVRPYHYKVQIPTGTTLKQLRNEMIGVDDGTIKILFSGLTKSDSLDVLFQHKEDKDSCIEMFGYLKESLLYR